MLWILEDVPGWDRVAIDAGIAKCLHSRQPLTSQ
jgi:hypothetical protein